MKFKAIDPRQWFACGDGIRKKVVVPRQDRQKDGVSLT